MAVTKGKIEKNLQRIRETVAAAAARAGRPVEQVTIVGVVKTVGTEEIKHLLDLGLSDVAESRVQQLAERAAEVRTWLDRRRNGAAQPGPSPRWHMIGHLQRNKVKQALEYAEVIHSVDSLRLAEEISSAAERLGRRADVMLQVNCSQEPQKHGVAVGAASHLAEMISSMAGVRLVGLMTMAPLSTDPEKARPSFVRLREIYDEMLTQGICAETLRHLSMGMSQDYAVAVEEGATMLRIGTALFS